jgi:hypothetical protein
VLGLEKLRPPKVGQLVHWDSGTDGQRGLSVLLSAGGTKIYRATYSLHGKFKSVKIGRVGEMKLGTARKLTEEYREKAVAGIDPVADQKKAKEIGRPRSHRGDRAPPWRFIEQYAKPRQRTWHQTERALKVSCRPFLKRPIAEISKREALELLDSFIAAGYLPEPPIMDRLDIEYETRVRDRVYDDDEIRATWHAADRLAPVEGAYVKLLMLLAPRKRELKQFPAYLNRWDSQ